MKLDLIEPNAHYDMTHGRPAVLEYDGNGSWLYRLNIGPETGIPEGQEEEARIGWRCYEVRGYDGATKDNVKRAVIRSLLDETAEFASVNSYNKYVLGIAVDEKAVEEHRNTCGLRKTWTRPWLRICPAKGKKATARFCGLGVEAGVVIGKGVDIGGDLPLLNKRRSEKGLPPLRLYPMDTTVVKAGKCFQSAWLWNRWTKVSGGFRRRSAFKGSTGFLCRQRVVPDPLTGCVVFFALNPKYLLERITEIRTEERCALVESRLKSDVEIGAALSGLLAATGADRAWLIELHNGSEDIATGLPFLYGSMRMEEVREGVYQCGRRIFRFRLVEVQACRQGDARRAFYGNLEDVRGAEERLYYKFRANDVNEVALTVIYGCDGNLIGF